MKLNRARRNAGKKARSTQSGKTTETTSGKTQSDSVTIGLFSKEKGRTVERFAIPRELFVILRMSSVEENESLRAFIMNAVREKVRSVESRAGSEPPEDAVWIQLIDAQGNILPDLKIPQALYDSLLACVPAQSSAGQPVAELPPCTAILHPAYETRRKSIATMIELSNDVVEFIDKVAGGPGVKLSDAFHRCVLSGLSALASEKTVKDASNRLTVSLSNLEDVHNQMQFFVESVRAAMPTWDDEGTWTKQHMDRMQVGFMQLWDRLSTDASEHTRAAREASRQSHFQPLNAVEKGGAR